MGPHIFQTCPSANYFDCKAMSIGARSQSARTYLERLMDTFQDCEYGDGDVPSHGEHPKQAIAAASVTLKMTSG